MKVGLASDSYGNVEALERAFEVLLGAGAERIFFLGGRYADVDAVLARRRSGAAAAPRATAPAADDELGFLRAVEGALRRDAQEDPAAEVERLAARIVRVAGRACPEYQRDRAPRKVFEMVNGLICCLVHDKSELGRDDIANATVLFHGNSGHPALVPIGPRLFVTPGHLRALDPDGRPPTFALVEMEGPSVELVVYSASGEEIRRDKAALATGARVSVR